MDFRHAPRRLLPDHMELGLFLLKLPQLSQHFHRIAALRQHQAICQHRRQDGKFVFALPAKPLSRKCLLQSCHGADAARFHLLHRFVLTSAVHPQLVCFLLPDFLLGGRAAGIAHRHLHPEHAACDFQMGQAIAGWVPGDFVHSGAEFPGVFRTYGEPADAFQQFLHAL